MTRGKRVIRGRKPKPLGYLNPDSFIEEIVEQEVEFACPKRGRVKEKVMVKKLRPVTVEDVKTVLIEDIVLNLEKESEDQEISEENEEDE